MDNPDLLEGFLKIWYDDVGKKLSKRYQKNIEYLVEKATIYISRIYSIISADKFNLNN